LEKIAYETGWVISAKQKGIDILAKIAFHRRIALECILAEQGGVCFITNISYWVYINTLTEVETHLKKIQRQVSYLQ
jgi:hypothetical protein